MSKRKFNHYSLLEIIAIGYVTLTILGLLGVILHIATGAEADFGIYR